MRKVKSKEKYNWISAKNPPKEDGRYLVVEEGKNYRWVGVCTLREGKWDSSQVTLWMPLPEPPWR
jgi:hypothetical protein